ncbi:MAG: hypothetical protein WBP81_07430 [Solirubrobacteraceae bacterium]
MVLTSAGRPPPDICSRVDALASVLPTVLLIVMQMSSRTGVTRYQIRMKGRLGVTALSAVPSMAHQMKGGETELTGFLEDSWVLFGVLAEIEALRLELLEFPEIPTGPKSP